MRYKNQEKWIPCSSFLTYCTSKLVKEYLKEQSYNILEWPAQSPDLNPIENMWSLLKRRLNDYETAPKGMNELYERVTKVWYDLMKPEECQKDNFVGHCKYNPRNSRLLSNLQGITKKSSPPSNNKNKYHCAIHGLANHPTDKCNKYKNLLSQSPTSVSPSPTITNSPMSFVSAAKNCFRCLGNVPWSKEHAARCPRDKPHYGPSKAIRSARLVTSSSNGNKPNLTITPQARPQQASSKVSSGDSNLMDVDDEGYPVNYDCKKLTKQNEVFKSTNHSLIVPITIENVNTMALVDSGSSFSTIDINFVNKYNIAVDRNVSGSVILATSDNVSKRFGTTKFPLSVIYGDNDKNLIHTSHSFEVLPLSLDTEVVIGHQTS
ncbi:hypothetical protein G6F43_013185 [Rhizopus delemar]|nr:hypothetical protein G6F43_013185 [Rhizopus delemar]